MRTKAIINSSLNKPLVVIGGGDSAVEEATYLTKFGTKVYLVHRRDELRASKVMQQRAFDNPKIELVWNHVLEDVDGDGDFLEKVILKHTETQKRKVIEANGLFYAIGHIPNTAFLEHQLDTDEQLYLRTLPGTTNTSVEGVFAAGDVQDKRYRQAVTSAGTGCMAALEAEAFLTEKGLI